MRRWMGRLWTTAAYLCLAAGLGIAFFTQGAAISLAAVLTLSMVSWVVLTVVSKDDPRTWSFAQGGRAVVWGCAALAIISGLGALQQLAGAVVLILLLTCPPLWQRLRRTWGRLSGDVPASRSARSPQPGHARPAVPPPGAPVARRSGDAPAVVHADPATLDDDALCLAWRNSFVRLQTAGSAPEVGRLVEWRQEILDELTRRHDAGVARWLASGARAASDPRRFLGQASMPPGQHP